MDKSGKSRFRVVLVEPEYELNVGAVARAMKNFGFSELFIVSPKCDPLGFDAIKYSKHARDLLESAKVRKSLSAATQGCRLIVGTTGVIYRHWNETIRSPIGLRDFVRKVKGQKEGKIALLFGNEGIGLTEKQISSCDFLVTIPSSDAYPTINLSHSVAIVLYELSDYAPRAFVPAGSGEKQALLTAFGLLVDRFASQMRNPRKVKIAFRRMVGKSMVTDKELSSVLGVLRRSNSELEHACANTKKNKRKEGK